VALLEQYRGEIKQTNIPPIEADDEGWVPEAIIASGPTDDDHKKHVFLVKWEGFTHEENTWETYEHLAKVAPELINKFYEQRPEMEKDKRWKKSKRTQKKRRTKK
jgi:hypothetical protein